MAVKMGGALHYEDIVAGSRVVGTRTANAVIPESESASRVLATSTGVMKALSIVGTSKRQSLLSSSIDSVLGVVVATQVQDGTRQYKILPGQLHGNRKQRVKDSDFRTVDQEQGQRIAKVLTGIGAFGIGYNPQPTTPEAKPIRKYPRDWHGENMH